MTTLLAEDVGARLREARHVAGRTQADLAASLEVREGDVRRWETGRNLPTARRLPALADELGVSLDWIFGRTDDGGPS